MNRLTVISKRINIRKIDIVVVHSFADAHKEAMDAMERGCDEAVVEDEVHNVVFRLIKPKKTNFDRVTASPEALAEFIYCLIEDCDYYAGNGARKISQYAVEDTEDKFHIELMHGNRDFGELLDWLKEESKE